MKSAAERFRTNLFPSAPFVTTADTNTRSALSWTSPTSCVGSSARTGGGGCARMGGGDCAGETDEQTRTNQRLARILGYRRGIGSSVHYRRRRGERGSVVWSGCGEVVHSHEPISGHRHAGEEAFVF